MRCVFAAILLLTAATAASADDTDPANSRHHRRAFWLSDQSWPNPQDDHSIVVDPRFSRTYSEELAARLGVVDGRAEFFDGHLNGPGEPGPAIVGEVNGGAAKIVLRWRPGE